MEVYCRYFKWQENHAKTLSLPKLLANHIGKPPRVDFMRDTRARAEMLRSN